jgi:hypothetical protein
LGQKAEFQGVGLPVDGYDRISEGSIHGADYIIRGQRNTLGS